ncbi:MAG: hypothetical protein HYV40_01315 [Candidatus Levybacteria bacterium]|nr:hypothetical protein [Candidatus Levybacteria bacterium]
METAFFWVAWGLISFWALKTFYYSFSKEKLERLRKTALGLTISVLTLTLLPWTSLKFGGITGLNLALEGNLLVLLFLILLIVSTVLFFAKDAEALKLASIATIANTILLFVTAYTLRPGAFMLTLYDIAPIIASLILLIADVVVLLLWQQLQLRDRGQKNKAIQLNKVLIFTGITILIISVLFLLRPQKNNGQEGVSLVSGLSEVTEFKKAVEESGRSKFGITVDHKEDVYSIVKVFESFPDHMTTFNWYKVENKTGKVYRQDTATDTWEEVK